MTQPIDDVSLSLNLSSHSSPQQRFERMLAQAGLAPANVSEITTAAGADVSVLSGPLSDRITRLNEVMHSYGIRFELSDFDSRVITQVVDRQTGEVIRQIPAEEMLKIAEAFSDDQGRLVDDRA